MHSWRKVTNRKKSRGNQTPGKSKGENCKANYLDKYMAKSNRSYKHKEYPTWFRKTKLATMKQN